VHYQRNESSREIAVSGRFSMSFGRNASTPAAFFRRMTLIVLGRPLADGMTSSALLEFAGQYVVLLVSTIPHRCRDRP
jgi:hypothetical protein